MWVYVQKLIEQLTSNDEAMLDDSLFNKYTTAFDQLMEIMENQETDIEQYKIHELQLVLRSLETKYQEAQQRLQDKITSERLKARAHAAYNHYSDMNNIGFNRKS